MRYNMPVFLLVHLCGLLHSEAINFPRRVLRQVVTPGAPTYIYGHELGKDRGFPWIPRQGNAQIWLAIPQGLSTCIASYSSQNCICPAGYTVMSHFDVFSQAAL